MSDIMQIDIPESMKPSLVAFNRYTDVKKFMDSKNKSLENSPLDHYLTWFCGIQNKETTEYLYRHIKRIGDELKNKEYSENLLTLSLLSIYYKHKHIPLKEITPYYVEKVRKDLSKERFRKDKQTVLTIAKELDIKTEAQLFGINDDGVSLIYNLIKKDYVSPIFYITMMDELNTIDRSKASQEFLRFEKISKQLKLLLSV